MTATLHQALDAAHAEAEAQRKRLATLQARLAMRGHELHALADGGFMACRWGLTRHLSTLEEVALFCVQVGV